MSDRRIWSRGLGLLLWAMCHTVPAQVGIGTTVVDPSALLQLESTTRALLLPRLNPADVSGPVGGSLVFDNIGNLLTYHNGTGWVSLVEPRAETADGVVATTVAGVRTFGLADVGVPLHKLSGNTGLGPGAAPDIAATNGQVLTWSAANGRWQPGTPAGGSQWVGTTNIAFTAGNVAIGTATAAERLHVDGNLRLVGNLALGASGSIAPIPNVPNGLSLTITGGNSVDASANTGGLLTLAGGDAGDAGNDTGGSVILRGGNGADAGNDLGGNVWVYGGTGETNGNVVLGHNGATAIGNVGIGTNNPGHRLHVQTGVATGAGILLVNDAAGGTSFPVVSGTVGVRLNAATSTESQAFGADVRVISNTANGQVGAFFINAQQTQSTGWARGVVVSASGGGFHNGVEVFLDQAANTGVNTGYYATLNNAAAANTGLDLSISNTNAGSTNRGIQVNMTGVGTRYAATFNGGNVGVGTTTPGAGLDVNTTVRLGPGGWATIMNGIYAAQFDIVQTAESLFDPGDADEVVVTVPAVDANDLIFVTCNGNSAPANASLLTLEARYASPTTVSLWIYNAGAFNVTASAADPVKISLMIVRVP